MFEIQALHHVSLLVQDTQRALAFYQDLLGLSVLERPALPFPGAWLDLGQGQQLHLLELPALDATSKRYPEHGGRDRHLALRIRGLVHLEQRLDTAGIAYTRSRSGRMALFCRDPDGNALEFIEEGV